MPRVKTTKTTRKVTKDIEEEPVFSAAEISHPTNAFKPQNYLNKKTIIVVLLLILAAVAIYKKNWIVAATVNGQPISNFAVLAKMNEQFRSQVVNQMVNEKVIFDEARKQGVTVKDSEINERIAKIETNFGGKEVFESMLAQQGQTRESVKNQLKIQLIIEKLYDKEASVSAEEVQQFVEQNKGQFSSSDSAVQTQEATEALKQQKVGQVFSQKFQELKKQANIKIF